MSTDTKATENLQISLGEISRSTGIDRAHISRIFSGKRKPSLEYFIRIANSLNISLDELAKILHLS